MRPLVLASPLILLLMAACTTPESTASQTPAADATASTAAGPTPGGAQEPPAPPIAPEPSVGPAPAQACDADAARGVVGQIATSEVVERARGEAGAQLVRVLKPGQMVTMEYHPSRLNLDVDADNRITNVRCG